MKAIAGGSLRTLAECEKFSTWELTLQGKTAVPADVRCVLCIGGNATLSCDGCESIVLQAGTCIYLPQGLQASISGDARVLWIK